MGLDNFFINNNGKKEQLGGIKHGIRREQVAEKYQNLFDAYDINHDGTLEEQEAQLIESWFTSAAGEDKTLDAEENKRLISIFAKEAGIENADFMGFVKSVSAASAEILSTTQTTTSDGGKQIVTSYKDGTIETIAYYPTGEYKFKHTEKHQQTTTTTYSAAGKQYTADELDKKIREIYNKEVQAFKKAQAQQSKDSTRLLVNPGSYKDFKKMFMQKYNIVSNTNTSKIDIDNLELSELAKQDVAVRDFVLSHFIETHKTTQENLDTMGILDDIGAAINAGAGELFNACKNIYNKHFGNGTEEDYKNFYELVKKFEPNYDKALAAEGDLEMMRQHPDMYFNRFEGDVQNYDMQKGAAFQKKTEQYQQAQVLKQRIEILKKARYEVEQYQNEQDALVHGGASSEGLNPASHIVNANNLLLQCFDNDQEAVNLLLNGSLSGNEGNAASAAQIQALIDETEKANAAVLGGKTFDEIKGEYNQQYKEMYGVDFVPDELNDKINDAKATGGMVKIAAITVVSILITKSPAMTEIMGAAAGSEAVTGASAAFIRTLVSKYGQTVVQQGIKFAMTTGTLATDVGLTLLNQVTDNREGIQWDEVGEAAKGSAKYIYFGAYVGSPLAQAVSQKIGSLGLAGKLMTGGAKTTQGAITTTTISGEKLVQNFMNTSKSVLAKGGALATEIGAFSGLELATGDVDPTKVVGEQAEMLTQLKLMNNVLEYMLGGKVHTAIQKANMEAAIEKSGVKNWTIKEIKTPKGTQYMVEAGGAQIGRFDNANDLASAMMGRVSMALNDIQGGNTSANDEVGTKAKTTNKPSSSDNTPQTKTEPAKAPQSEGAKQEETKPEPTQQAKTETQPKADNQPEQQGAVEDTAGKPKTPADLSKALDSANSREDFVAIRDEIKKLPKGKEKQALIEKYQTKYREWSTNPARPDIRMQYIPDENGSAQQTKAAAGGETMPQTETAPKETDFISEDKAKEIFAEKFKDADEYKIGYLTEICSLNGKVSQRLVNEALELQKAGINIYDVQDIIRDLKNKDVIDEGAVTKYHELVNNGVEPKDAARTIFYSKDKSGNYSEDRYNKLTSIKADSYRANSILEACEINGNFVESVYQKALELQQLGVEPDKIENIIKACHIKEGRGISAKTIDFSDTAYDKAKVLLTQYHFDAKNISSIIGNCLVDGKFSKENFNRAIGLQGKIGEGYISDYVDFPDDAVDFMLELRNQLKTARNIDIEYIMNECVKTQDGKKVSIPECVEKVKELLNENEVPVDDISRILSASKRDGVFDENLYNQALTMYKGGIKDLGWIIRNSQTKDTDGQTNPAAVNYDLLNKSIEWKKLGFEDNEINNLVYFLNRAKIDISKHDYVTDCIKAGFESSDIINMLQYCDNNVDFSFAQLAPKVLEMKETGMSKENITSIVYYYFNSGNNDKTMLKAENFDIAIDMYKRGIENPAKIINRTTTQDELNKAYEYVKQGLDENRINYILIMKYRTTRNEETENFVKELAAALDSKSENFETFAHLIEDNPAIAKNLIEAIKAGADEKSVIEVAQKRNYEFYNQPEDAIKLRNEIRNKCLAAIKEKPENAAKISEMMTTGIYGEMLDICLKYPANWRQIIETTRPYRYGDEKTRQVSSSACAEDLIIKLEEAGIPLETTLKLADTLCVGQRGQKFAPEAINKIIELQYSGKLDDKALSLIKNVYLQDEKAADVIDLIIKYKEQNLLDDEAANNSYFTNILIHNTGSTVKIYDNYAEILDFYIKNRDILKSKVTSPNGYPVGNINGLISCYKNYNSNTLNLAPFNAAVKLVQDAGVDSYTIERLIQSGLGDNLEEFVEKADLKNYSNEIKLILENAGDFYGKGNREILTPQLSKEHLNYLLDLQKLFIEKNPENPQIISVDFVKMFVEYDEKGVAVAGKDIPEDALNKLRYYVEMDLAGSKQYINTGDYSNLLNIYSSNTEQIARIENVLFAGLADSTISRIKEVLSDDPEVLELQLKILEKTVDSLKDSYLQANLFDLISSNYETAPKETLEARLKFLEKYEAELHPSFVQRTVDAFKNTNRIQEIVYTAESVYSGNTKIIELIMSNRKKYQDYTPHHLLSSINENNQDFIYDCIVNNKVKGFGEILRLADATKNIPGCAEFIQKHFDMFPADKLADIAYSFNQVSKDLILKLYGDKTLNFPQEYIPGIINFVDEANINFITRLCTDKTLNFPPEHIAKIAEFTAVSRYSSFILKFAEKLCYNKSFPKDKIAEILQVTDEENIELAEKLCTDKSLKCPPDKVHRILEAARLLDKDIKTLTLSQKLNTMAAIKDLSKETAQLLRTYTNIDIDAKLSELSYVLGKKKDVVRISDEQQKLFVESVIANNNPAAENVFKNFDFKQYGKQGLPLQYSREQFTANIENLIKDLSPEEQNTILDHFGLTRGAAGFDGLPNNKPFTDNNASTQMLETAEKVRREIETFTTQNTVHTGDITTDNVLNGLLRGLPEFTSIVGKEQHGTHAYSVDIHTLKVLQSAMNNPLYETLSDKDKTILKIAALCHDLGKKGGVVDTGHAGISAEYVTGILDKFSFPQGMKDRIIDIVENHHWFEAYNTGKATAEDIAVRCRRPEDFVIYEILSKADFENVNDDFHLTHSDGVKTQADFDKFMQDKMRDIDDALSYVYSKSNLVFDTKFVQNGSKFPKQIVNVDGEPTELKVLNLNDLKDNDSLEQYGFSRGVTKDSARFFVHMTEPNTGKLESVIILTQNSLNQSAWSTSLIKANNNRTYCDRKFGFVLDVDLANISEANYENTSSGNGKGLESFKWILFSSNNAARTFVKDHLTSELAKHGIKLNDKEYAALSKYLMSKQYTTQINKDVKIGDKVINASVLVECLEKSRDALFEGGDIHSEIVPINPRVKGLIAKVDKIEDCPEEFLEIAKKYNLPIILMKPKKSK